MPSACKFATTRSGTLVYDNCGNVEGFYETDDEATKMLRERSMSYLIGGADNGI